MPHIRYVLNPDYTTGALSAEQLSQGQVKESKHFEALAARMRSTGWTITDVFRLLMVFPFMRSREDERLHAFWTRRLRDQTSICGRATDEEFTIALMGQSD